MDDLIKDMELHRKWSRLYNEGMRFCNHNANCPRAQYFGLNQMLKKRHAYYIKLLVQVPNSFSQQIPQLLEK
jgi:hypothetical protein